MSGRQVSPNEVEHSLPVGVMELLCPPLFGGLDGLTGSDAPDGLDGSGVQLDGFDAHDGSPWWVQETRLVWILPPVWTYRQVMAPYARKEIDSDWVAEMAEERGMARRDFEGTMARARARCGDRLDRFGAWVSGFRGDERYHWAEPTREVINELRADGWTWRQTAVITEGDEEAADRVERKQAWRNQCFEEFHAGVGEFNGPDSGGVPSI
jgi:hypothetical protein